MQGFSVTNLKRMKLFVLAYPDFEISAQAVHQLPWGHIVILLHRIKDADVRLWYAQKTLEHGWSRSILEMQIESDLYGRQGVPDMEGVVAMLVVTAHLVGVIIVKEAVAHLHMMVVHQPDMPLAILILGMV